MVADLPLNNQNDNYSPPDTQIMSHLLV